MEIYQHIDQVPQLAHRSPVLTIGNFDGVHLGHRKIFERLLSCADEANGAALCLTFDPHPLKVLRDESIKLLVAREEKIRILRRLGISGLILHPFDPGFAALSPEAFVQQILKERLGVRKLVVGYDYAFGKDRRGDQHFFDGLHQRGELEVEVVPALQIDGQIVSSSLIRHLVEQGDVDVVPRYLGRPYTLSGLVMEGDHRGKKIGFPTANLAYIQELLPPTGVYATIVRIGQKSFVGVTNIGYNPTFVQRRAVSVETHILDFDGDIYRMEIEVAFLEKIRDEKKFQSVSELVNQIERDVAHTRRKVTPPE